MPFLVLHLLRLLRLPPMFHRIAMVLTLSSFPWSNNIGTDRIITQRMIKSDGLKRCIFLVRVHAYACACAAVVAGSGRY